MLRNGRPRTDGAREFRSTAGPLFAENSSVSLVLAGKPPFPVPRPRQCQYRRSGLRNRASNTALLAALLVYVREEAASERSSPLRCPDIDSSIIMKCLAPRWTERLEAWARRVFMNNGKWRNLQPDACHLSRCYIRWAYS